MAESGGKADMEGFAEATGRLQQRPVQRTSGTRAGQHVETASEEADDQTHAAQPRNPEVEERSQEETEASRDLGRRAQLTGLCQPRQHTHGTGTGQEPAGWQQAHEQPCAHGDGQTWQIFAKCRAHRSNAHCRHRHHQRERQRRGRRNTRQRTGQGRWDEMRDETEAQAYRTALCGRRHQCGDCRETDCRTQPTTQQRAGCSRPAPEDRADKPRHRETGKTGQSHEETVPEEEADKPGHRRASKNLQRKGQERPARGRGT